MNDSSKALWLSESKGNVREKPEQGSKIIGARTLGILLAFQYLSSLNIASSL